MPDLNHCTATDALSERLDEMADRLEPYNTIFYTLAHIAPDDQRTPSIAIKLFRIRALAQKLEKFHSEHEQRYAKRQGSASAWRRYHRATRRYLAFKIFLMQEVLTLAYLAEGIIAEYSGHPALRPLKINAAA